MPRAVSIAPRRRRFRIFCPATTFRKSGVDDGQPGQMRIAGVISTDRLDHQGEKVLQKGLDLTYLLGERGTYNNEHGGTHHDVLGFPQTVNRFQKGDILPNGQTASNNCTWCEGVLLNEPDGIKTFEKAQAYQEHGRSLGFSIEGAVTERRGAGGYIISKAKVNHVAITHQPVNDDTQLELLVRSLKPRRTGNTVSSRKAMQVSVEGGGDGDAQRTNPMVRRDKSPKVADLAGPDDAEQPPQPRKSGPGRKRRQRPVVKKSRECFDPLQSVFEAFPFAGVGFAVRLAAQLDPNRKGHRHAR